MADYKLQANEMIILQTDRVAYGNGRNSRDLIHSLMMTNRNIILTLRRGLLNTRYKDTLVFPLSAIKVHNNQAQVFVVRATSGVSELDVYFRDSVERFMFDKAEMAGNLFEEINLAVVGVAYQAPPPVGALQELADVFKSTFSLRPIPTVLPPASALPPLSKRAGDCSSCGAPVSGYPGSITSCSYCDTPLQF